MIVVDASVVVKWFFAEHGSDAAIELLAPRADELVAPDILMIEVAAALVRKANMDKRQAPGVRRLLDDFAGRIEQGIVNLHRLEAQTMRRAADVAIEMGHPLKDCLYLALARELGIPLVTADARFAERSREAPIGRELH